MSSFIQLEKNGLLQLTWIPGETGHLLQSIALPKTKHGTSNTELFHLLARTPIANNRARLESFSSPTNSAFRVIGETAISYILNQLKAEKSPAPFSLTDSSQPRPAHRFTGVSCNDSESLSRVSVRVFNDTKRFEAIKSHIVSLARLGNPEWKRLSTEEVRHELNLVANPNYIHLSGNWQITTGNGEILNLSGFTPSIGFPAAQTSTLQSVRANPFSASKTSPPSINK